jgi:hypothetical protein
MGIEGLEGRGNRTHKRQQKRTTTKGGRCPAAFFPPRASPLLSSGTFSGDFFDFLFFSPASLVLPSLAADDFLCFLFGRLDPGSVVAALFFAFIRALTYL